MIKDKKPAGRPRKTTCPTCKKRRKADGKGYCLICDKRYQKERRARIENGNHVTRTECSEHIKKHTNCKRCGEELSEDEKLWGCSHCRECFDIAIGKIKPSTEPQPEKEYMPNGLPQMLIDHVDTIDLSRRHGINLYRKYRDDWDDLAIERGEK